MAAYFGGSPLFPLDGVHQSVHTSPMNSSPIKNWRGLNLALRRQANNLKVRLTDFSIVPPATKGGRTIRRGTVSFNVDSAYWHSAVPHNEAVDQLATVVKRANFRWTNAGDSRQYA